MRNKRWKAVLAAVCITGLVVSVTACGSEEKAAQTQGTTQILQEENISVSQLVDNYTPLLGRAKDLMPEGGEVVPESGYITGSTFAFRAEQLDFTENDLDVSLYYATDPGNSAGVDAGFIYSMVWQVKGDELPKEVAEKYLEELYLIYGDKLITDRSLDNTSVGCSALADGEHKVIKGWYEDGYTVNYELDEINGVIQSFYLSWQKLN